MNQAESVFPMSVLLFVSGHLTVAPLRLRRLRLSRLDLRKTSLVLAINSHFPMMPWLRLLLFAVLLCGWSPTAAAQLPARTEFSVPLKDPDRWAEAINKFLNDEVTTPVLPGKIVATGSSSIGYWHKTLQQDMAPLSIVPRGFGGSILYDLWYHREEVIFCPQPRAVILYVGDNDIATGLHPEEVMLILDSLCREIRQRLPESRVYILSVKPSPSRWNLQPQFDALNALYQQYAAEHPNTLFVEMRTVLLLPDGTPDPACYLRDGLHLNREGYRRWTEVLRPVLLERELNDLP
ncbi:MAG: GDSL-type esterase/lipase family protein [Candidatus Sumerlaeia bacterium]|nr:GDSL-type esterase/lipase family protein [Candidatus Sumerlaeia bacterium]